MTRLPVRLTCLALLAPFAAGITSAAAQDTSQVKEGIRVGLDYNPGVQPGLVVLPGAGLDSVRAELVDGSSLAGFRPSAEVSEVAWIEPHEVRHLSPFNARLLRQALG